MTAATSQNRVSGGRSRPAHPKPGFWVLTLGSIGVVYGDIGTSPLYAFRESAVAAVGPGNPANETVVLGILSLIIWALILIVTVKYVVILLRADNNGEGGTRPSLALSHSSGSLRSPSPARGAESCSVVCFRSDLRRRVPCESRAYRSDNARRRFSRGHRLRSALCRSRAFRPRSNPHRLAHRRLAGADNQLSW